MGIKTIAIGLLTLLIVLSIFSIFINYLNIVIYVDKIQSIRESVFVIIDQSMSEISLAKYIVYEINLYEQFLCKPLLVVNHEISSFIIREIGVNNIYIETGLSNSTPVILPKTIVSFEEYELLIRKRYVLEQIQSSVENTTIRSSVKSGKYLLIIVRYSINSSKYIDFTKYLPPIIYYPRKLSLNNTFTELIKYSTNDTLYSSILTYSLNTMLNEYSFINVFVEYIVSPRGFNYGFFTISWIILLIITEFAKPKITLYYSKKLFYKLLFLLNYMLRKLRELKQRIRELSRV